MNLATLLRNPTKWTPRLGDPQFAGHLGEEGTTRSFADYGEMHTGQVAQGFKNGVEILSRRWRISPQNRAIGTPSGRPREPRGTLPG